MKKISLLAFLLATCLSTMAATYSNSAAAIPLYPGQCTNLLTSETPAGGAFSQQVSVPTRPEQPGASLSFEFRFSANPGATMNYQVQDADTDATGNYVSTTSPGTSTAIALTSCPISVGGSYTCRIEFSPWRGLFARIYTNTANGNAASLTVQVCR